MKHKNMAVKTAIVGLGIMGRRMLEHLIIHSGYKPVSLWDPNPKACKQAQMLAPDALVTASADAAIELADLIYLSCPPTPRKAYALKAAAAGKAIFLEKPLGVNVGESENLVAILKSSGVPAAVNFTQAAGDALTDVSQSVRNGELGEIVGVDIIVTYGAWPRAWQRAADWLRFGHEGGMTREVISHFLFFSERVLGPLKVIWARPCYPDDSDLCETHLLARLETLDGRPVTIMASVGGAQPDRQELTIKGTKTSRRISEFYLDAISDGHTFTQVKEPAKDPRAASLKGQLDDLLLCFNGKSNRLATPEEALRVQKLVEIMLVGKT